MTATVEDTSPAVETLTSDNVQDYVGRQRARLRRAAKVEDTLKRAQKAAAIADEVQAVAEKARVPRDQAATALNVIHGLEPVEVYRLTDVTRSLFARIKKRVTGRGIDPVYQDKDYALQVARTLYGVPKALDEFLKEVREVRDPALRELVASGMSNADVGRRMANPFKPDGMTGPRVSQINNETSPAA